MTNLINSSDRPVTILEERAEQLVELAAAGDSDALSRLFHAHAAGMLRVAYHLLGSQADAEDVVHDVFLGLPEALQGYQEQGKLGGWIRRLAVRTALGRMRSHQREVSIELLTDQPIDRTPEPVSDWLERGIKALPETLRAVFVLKEVEGYSHAEIGEMLGIRRGTSEVRHHRAIRRLRAMLKESS